VYAIDIDPKKIEICKNNCKIYNCKNNIYFIEHDFLKIEEYEPIKVRADYIFLSPPWGGISYKNSDIYSIKESMKPDISEIIKVSLRIVKYIQFYVPRTLQLEELFGIISEIKGANRLFFDIHILKSANKIKALLIIFGYDIDKKICEKEIDEYIKYIYENFNLNEINVKLISSIAKIIGNYRFLENEINFRKSLKEDFGNEIHDENFNVLKKLFNYFFKVVLNDQEKIKLKSLKIYSQYKSLNNNKSKLNKKNNNKVNTIDKNKDKDQKENSDSNKNSISNSESSCNFIEKYTVTYTGDNNETYLNMKEYDKNEGEKIIIQKNPKIKKKICLKELFSNDKKMILSNVSTPTVSTSPSPIITSNNNNSILSVSTKNGKNQGEWILTPCNEIKLSFIKK
jgi:predicted RNA methylase